MISGRYHTGAAVAAFIKNAAGTSARLPAAVETRQHGFAAGCTETTSVMLLSP